MRRSLITAVAGTDDDFEWYPTTKEIIDAMSKEIKRDVDAHFIFESLLDCGAGDGNWCWKSGFPLCVVVHLAP